MVVVLRDRLLDHVVIDQTTGRRIRFALDPDLDLPAVAVEVRAFPLVIEQPVACIDLDFLIDRDGHYLYQSERDEDIILLRVRLSG